MGWGGDRVITSTDLVIFIKSSGQYRLSSTAYLMGNTENKSLKTNSAPNSVFTVYGHEATEQLVLFHPDRK